MLYFVAIFNRQNMIHFVVVFNSEKMWCICSDFYPLLLFFFCDKNTDG